MPSRTVRALFALLGALAAHAVTGQVAHLVDHVSVEAHGHLHHVNGPIAVSAGVALVAAVGWRLWNGLPSASGGAAVLGSQIGILTVFVGAETLAAENGPAHVLHDPWVLASPAAVLLAHALTFAVAMFLVATLQRAGAPQAWGEPSAALRTPEWTDCARLVDGVLGGAWGRAPPMRVIST